MVRDFSAATVSSLMMGFAWGFGSLLAPVVGLIGDRLGLHVALSITAVMPLVAAAFALPQPKTVPERVSTVEPAPWIAESDA